MLIQNSLNSIRCFISSCRSRHITAVLKMLCCYMQSKTNVHNLQKHTCSEGTPQNLLKKIKFELEAARSRYKNSVILKYGFKSRL